MGSRASEKNSIYTATWADTATSSATEVAVARGKDSAVPALRVSIMNTGATAMLFSLDGAVTWLPVAAGQSFDWECPVYAVSGKTAAGTTTYAVVAGY